MTTQTQKRWTKKRSRTLEQLVDDVFVFCGLSESAERNELSLGVLKSCTPQDFEEAEAMLFSDGDDLFEIGGREIQYFTDVHPKDVPKFDVSACKFEEDEDGKPYILLTRFRQVTPKHARGQKIWSPYLGSLWECLVDVNSGVYQGCKRVVNKIGSSWVQVGQVRESQWFYAKKADHARLRGIEDDAETTTDVCQCLLGIQFTRDLEWRVVIKSQNRTSLSFPTDVRGAMAAFKHRDVNDQTGRRDAFRNWVVEHYRKRAGADDDVEKEIKVREHLRGRTPFRWLGMDCELVVAPWDERRNERLRQERELEKELARSRA